MPTEVYPKLVYSYNEVDNTWMIMSINEHGTLFYPEFAYIFVQSIFYNSPLIFILEAHPDNLTITRELCCNLDNLQSYNVGGRTIYYYDFAEINPSNITVKSPYHAKWILENNELYNVQALWSQTAATIWPQQQSILLTEQQWLEKYELQQLHFELMERQSAFLEYRNQQYSQYMSLRKSYEYKTTTKHFRTQKVIKANRSHKTQAQRINLVHVAQPSVEEQPKQTHTTQQVIATAKRISQAMREKERIEQQNILFSSFNDLLVKITSDSTNHYETNLHNIIVYLNKPTIKGLPLTVRDRFLSNINLKCCIDIILRQNKQSSQWSISSSMIRALFKKLLGFDFTAPSNAEFLTQKIGKLMGIFPKVLDVEREDVRKIFERLKMLYIQYKPILSSSDVTTPSDTYTQYPEARTSNINLSLQERITSAIQNLDIADMRELIEKHDKKQKFRDIFTKTICTLNIKTDETESYGLFISELKLDYKLLANIMRQEIANPNVVYLLMNYALQYHGYDYYKFVWETWDSSTFTKYIRTLKMTHADAENNFYEKYVAVRAEILDEFEEDINQGGIWTLKQLKDPVWNKFCHFINSQEQTLLIIALQSENTNLDLILKLIPLTSAAVLQQDCSFKSALHYWSESIALKDKDKKAKIFTALFESYCKELSAMISKFYNKKSKSHEQTLKSTLGYIVNKEDQVFLHPLLRSHTSPSFITNIFEIIFTVLNKATFSKVNEALFVALMLAKDRSNCSPFLLLEEYRNKYNLILQKVDSHFINFHEFVIPLIYTTGHPNVCDMFNLNIRENHLESAIHKTVEINDANYSHVKNILLHRIKLRKNMFLKKPDKDGCIPEYDLIGAILDSYLEIDNIFSSYFKTIDGQIDQSKLRKIRNFLLKITLETEIEAATNFDAKANQNTIKFNGNLFRRVAIEVLNKTLIKMEHIQLLHDIISELNCHETAKLEYLNFIPINAAEDCFWVCNKTYILLSSKSPEYKHALELLKLAIQSGADITKSQRNILRPILQLFITKKQDLEPLNILVEFCPQESILLLLKKEEQSDNGISAIGFLTEYYSSREKLTEAFKDSPQFLELCLQAQETANNKKALKVRQRPG